MKRRKTKRSTPAAAAPEPTAPRVDEAAELIEGVEVDSETRGAAESVETDEAATLLDRDIVEERTPSPGGCSLPDEERSKSTDIG